jgi:hypothetical protein
MKGALLTLVLFCLMLPLYPQSGDNTEWLDFIEEMLEEETHAETLESLYEELSYLAEHPFNVHTLTRRELERLPFLTPIQIENLLYYIYKYGPIVDLYELKNVEDLDLQTIRYLLPFIYIGDEEEGRTPIRAKDLWKKSKQEVLLRTNFTLQEKEEYKNGQYLGEPYYLSMRYNYNYADRLLFGFTAEKDPGEVLLKPKAEGFDHYAFNLSIKDIKMIEMLSLGDYRLSFGEGLALNTNFSMGKTSDITTINQGRGGIKRHTSTSESNYFRGIAATLRFRSIRTTLFYSHKKEDTNVDGDRIKTFLTDGYHRTENERNKKDAASVDLAGARLEWQSDRLDIGVTGVYYAFGGKQLNPEARDYNLYYLRGKDHLNAGLDYRYRWKQWMLQGEIAVDKAGKAATLHNLLLYPLPNLDLMFSFRHYDKAYNALYGKAFGESSAVQNETGFYAGLKLHPFRYWELTAYADHFRFPYIKYGVDAPSSGHDYLLQLLYFPKKNWQVSIRYRHKQKAENMTLGDRKEVYVLPYKQQRWRLQLDYKLNTAINLKSQIHYNTYEDVQQRQEGWSITQSAGYATPKLSLDASIAYFHSPDWNTRINVYEKNILYAFSFPMYYGKGFRYYLNLKWKICPPLTIYLKIADELKEERKTDMYLLLRYKF